MDLSSHHKFCGPPRWLCSLEFCPQVLFSAALGVCVHVHACASENSWLLWCEGLSLSWFPNGSVSTIIVLLTRFTSHTSSQTYFFYFYFLKRKFKHASMPSRRNDAVWEMTFSIVTQNYGTLSHLIREGAVVLLCSERAFLKCGNASYSTHPIGAGGKSAFWDFSTTAPLEWMVMEQTVWLHSRVFQNVASPPISIGLPAGKLGPWERMRPGEAFQAGEKMLEIPPFLFSFLLLWINLVDLKGGGLKLRPTVLQARFPHYILVRVCEHEDSSLA